MKTKTPILSIIVPIYNVEKYLSTCLNSILSQSFTDYELLLIDDGSTDSSWKVCNYYASKDSRIKVFHKVNEGVSVARNLGIEKSTGKWLYFADADDELTPNCLEILTSNITETVDLVEGRYLPVGLEKPSILPQFDSSKEVFTKQDYIYNLYRYKIKQYHGYLWNKIFRASVIAKSNIRFHNDIFFKEDGLFIMEYACKMSKQVLYLHELVYIYYKRDTGMMKTYLNKVSSKSISHLRAVNLMYEALGTINPTAKLRNAAKDEICRSYIVLRKRNKSHETKKEIDVLLKKHVTKLFFFLYCLKWAFQKIFH